MAKVTFQVKTDWNSGDGFKITSTGKDFQIGGQTIERGKPFTLVSDFPAEFRGRSDGSTVCEMCMASIGDHASLRQS